MKRLPVSAFSLVEVTLALGLIAFCVVALLGLMPVALESVRDADRQAEAVRLLEHFATGIRRARPDEAGQYRMIGFDPFGDVVWHADGAPLPSIEGTLSASGAPAPKEDSVFAYRLEITPPDASEPASFGRAMVRIAWPSIARWSDGEWVKAQGGEEALVIFRAQ